MGAVGGAVGLATGLLGFGLASMMGKQQSNVGNYDYNAINYQQSPAATMPKAPEVPGEDEGAAEEDAGNVTQKQEALRQAQSGENHTSGLGLTSPAYTNKKKLLGGSA